MFSRSRQTALLVDDHDLSRTQEYTWIIELLRLLHNTIVKVIESWEGFEQGELQYFYTGPQKTFHSSWNNYLATIEKDLTELRFQRRCLQQRIEMFDNMKAGVSTTSITG